MVKKLVKTKNYLVFSAYTTLNKMQDFTDAAVNSVYAKVSELGLKQTGPIEFLYFDCSSDRDKQFLLEIAIPIETIPAQTVEGFTFKKQDDFNCVSYIHKGDIFSLGDVYEKLFTEIWNGSMRPTNQIREVYSVFKDPASPENVTEIQIGIQG